MAEHYRFMDAVQGENGEYDREYNAQEFTDYFKALVTTGIMKGAGNELAVSANGSNMITSVSTGIAFLLGRYYENDSPLELTHDTETLGNSRIDRIVVRMDLSTESRYVKAFIKKGAPSTNPVAPTLVQTANLYEISLAQVKVVGGQTFIATNAVTDERGKDITCPWAGSNILPNFNDEALQDLVDKVNTTSTTVNQLNVNKANKQQGPWILMTLNANWTHGSSPLQYFKDEFGIVHVSGQVKKGVSAQTLFTTFPVGYRPGNYLYIPCLVQGRFGALSVDNMGNIYPYSTTVADDETISIQCSFRTL